MIGLLGAKIWKENGVDFGNPINLVPVAAGVIIAIGNTTLVFNDNFQLSGIALGTIVTIAAFHLVRLLAPPHLREDQRLAAQRHPPVAVVILQVVGERLAPHLEGDVLVATDGDLRERSADRHEPGPWVAGGGLRRHVRSASLACWR